MARGLTLDAAGTRARARWLLVALGLACRPTVGSSVGSSEAPAEATATASEQPRIVATYEPSPPEVVEAMLALAELTADDRLVDLGSGDGRIVIAAARDYGAESIGVEFDEQLVRRSRASIASAGLEGRARIIQGDLHRHPLAGTTVLTLFLWPSDNQRLHDAILRDMEPGSRVVSHDHDMEGWPPDRAVEVYSERFMRVYDETSMVYLWIVPGVFEGCWSDDADQTRLEVHQDHQVLTGRLWVAGRSLELDEGRARGAEAQLVARDERGAIELSLSTRGEGLRLDSDSIAPSDQPLHPCPERGRSSSAGAPLGLVSRISGQRTTRMLIHDARPLHLESLLRPLTVADRVVLRGWRGS